MNPPTPADFDHSGDGSVCKICSSSSLRSHIAEERMFGYGDQFTYAECFGCGCLQLVTPPPNLEKFYPENYYSYSSSLSRSRIRKLLLRWRNEYAVFNRNVIGRWLYRKFPDDALRSLAKVPLSPDKRILDVGCGSGHLLSQLRTLGFENTQGLDPFNKSDFVSTTGVPILKRSLREIEGSWDVIMFHHSFEHIPDPQETLLKVSHLLSDSGSCLIRIPISSSYAWRHYGVNWVQLDAPRHFFLHSVKSMQILAERAGMVISDIAFDSTAFQFWGSEQYKKNIPLFGDQSYLVDRDRSSFTVDEIKLFTVQARELNRNADGDQAVFYIRNR